MKVWREYFITLLEGVKGRVIRGGGKRVGEDGELEISREEIRETVCGLKDRKAAGMDEVPSEVWKYEGEEVERWVWIYCNKVWRGEEWPDCFKEGIIVPIIKKGEGERVEEYRGMTLMSTLYKVYATVLAGRVKKELEEKQSIPHNQTGFRKGIIDNIYVLNYLINKRVEKKKGKLVALFVDFKAAFDSVDWETLVVAMRGRGVREGLVVRTEEIMREMISRVRIGNEVGEGFWTARGVRQGCPLSPILFVVLAEPFGGVDGEGKVRRGEIGRGEGVHPSVC